MRSLCSQTCLVPVVACCKAVDQAGPARGKYAMMGRCQGTGRWSQKFGLNQAWDYPAPCGTEGYKAVGRWLVARAMVRID